MKKIFFGWSADKDKVIDGTLSVKKNDVGKSEIPSKVLSQAGIYLFDKLYIYFDDNIDKVEFLFNDESLPDWVKPLVLNEEQDKRIPYKIGDIYTIECVRDIIYWWFELLNKKLTKEKKERIAKIVGLNFHREKYCKFIDYNFNRPEYRKWLNKQIKSRK